MPLASAYELGYERTICRVGDWRARKILRLKEPILERVTMGWELREEGKGSGARGVGESAWKDRSTNISANKEFVVVGMRGKEIGCEQ